MCESDVYFETYRHVYSVLKSFTEETFPMKNYIIDVDVSFGYSPMDQTSCNCRIKFLIELFLAITSLSQLYSGKGENWLHLQTAYAGFEEYINLATSISDEIQWQPIGVIETCHNETVFCHSRYLAIDKPTASNPHLIKIPNFHSIQGPPGCGKTHMGLAIIATLLMNTDSQILIVSYTNHALDQFLTGILRYTDSIVRIGNQSKNEQLDCFNIKQLCENGITDKRVKTGLFKLKLAYAEAVQEFHDLQSMAGDEGSFEKYKQIQVGLFIHSFPEECLFFIKNGPIFNGNNFNHRKNSNQFRECKKKWSKSASISWLNQSESLAWPQQERPDVMLWSNCYRPQSVNRNSTKSPFLL